MLLIHGSKVRSRLLSSLAGLRKKIDSERYASISGPDSLLLSLSLFARFRLGGSAGGFAEKEKEELLF